jgi:hypothetical protein
MPYPSTKPKIHVPNLSAMIKRVPDQAIRGQLLARNKARTSGKVVFDYEQISLAFTDIFVLAAETPLEDEAVTKRLSLLSELLKRISAARAAWLSTEGLARINDAFIDLKNKHEKLHKILTEKLPQDLLAEIEEEWEIACAKDR